MNFEIILSYTEYGKFQNQAINLLFVKIPPSNQIKQSVSAPISLTALDFPKTDLCDEIHLRIFDLICPLHIVNVHSDLVFDMMGQFSTARSNSGEHDTSPELPLIQQLHGLIDELSLCRCCFEFVQIDTLMEKQSS